MTIERLRMPAPEAGHTGGLSARPNEYEWRVVGFFERTLFPGVEDTS